MQTVRAIAFWERFEACVNGAFELRSGSRQERCDGVRACVTVRGEDGREVGLSSKQVERTDGSVRVKV